MDFRLSAEDWRAGPPVSMFYEEVPVFSNDAKVIMIEDGLYNGSLRLLSFMLMISLSLFMWILSSIWRLMRTWSNTP